MDHQLLGLKISQALALPKMCHDLLARMELRKPHRKLSDQTSIGIAKMKIHAGERRAKN